MAHSSHQKNLPPPLKIDWWKVYGIAIIVLICYFFLYFGFPKDGLFENLWGDYSSRTQYWYGMRVRSNVPLMPDKFITLSALLGFSLLLVVSLTKNYIALAIIRRLLMVVGILLVLPISFYLFIVASLLLFIFLIVGIFYYVIKGTYRYIRYGKF